MLSLWIPPRAMRKTTTPPATGIGELMHIAMDIGFGSGCSGLPISFSQNGTAAAADGEDPASGSLDTCYSLGIGIRVQATSTMVAVVQFLRRTIRYTLITSTVKLNLGLQTGLARTGTLMLRLNSTSNITSESNCSHSPFFPRSAH